MASFSSAEAFLRAVMIAAYVILVLKLWQTGLRRVYKLFFIYVVVRLVRSLVLFPIPTDKTLYGTIFVLSLPLLWFLYVMVVLELYSLVLGNYTGIASLGRWALIVALVISVFVSGISLLPDLSNPAEKYPKLLPFLVIERGVVSSLAIFLLLISAFVVWYPVPLNRNTLIHCIVFSVYFLSSTMGFLIRNVTGHQVTPGVNLAVVITALVTLLMWIAFLNRAGEARTVLLRYQWRAEDEERLVGQLNAINSTLLRAARK